MQDTATTIDEPRLLKAILWDLADGVIVADLEGRFLLFNPSAEKMLGIGAQEARPEEWAATYGCYLPDRVTPYPSDQLPLTRAIRGEEIADVIIYIKNPQKPSGVWISVCGKPLRDSHGSLWGGLVFFRDVTRQEESEAKLHSTALQISAIIDNHNTALLVESDTRRIQSINRAFCDLFGISAPPSELVGTECSRAARQAAHFFSDPVGFVNGIDRLLERRAIVTGERLPLRDGRVLERDYIPIVAGDRCLGHVWQYRDITEQETARRRIPVFERLWKVLELTTDSVLITDKHGVIEYVNPGFETTSGYSREEALGKTPQILKSGEHDDEFYRDLWKTIRAGQPFRATVINRKKSGELYSCEQTITPMKDSTGNTTHFVSVLKDVTELLEKKEQEAQIRLARVIQQRFYRKTAALSGFDIAGVTHPADETGGDYYDFIQLPDGRLGIAIGDVSGHGISAALIMAATRAYVRAFTATHSDAAEVLTQVNRALVTDLEDSTFVTLLLCLLNPQQGCLSYSGAGHVPGYLFDHSGEVRDVLDSSGPPLGVGRQTVYTSTGLRFSNPGQLLLLTTDGVMESESPAAGPFGLEGTIRHVIAHRHESAAKIAESLYAAARSHMHHQPLVDDNTIVVIKAK
jgi:PAS domain S-box-containing protein